jgi:hypothetical protein
MASRGRLGGRYLPDFVPSVRIDVQPTSWPEGLFLRLLVVGVCYGKLTAQDQMCG